MLSSIRKLGIVAIGRNEGERLKHCLRSLADYVEAQVPVVYVDSGSSDGSQAFARSSGVDVVELDTSIPFTAARARNAGASRLIKLSPDVAWIQFVDSDCILHSAWLPVATETLHRREELAVVCGRRRELHPEESIYNAMINCEWDTPIGPAKACGGDALFRRAAFDEVGGFNDSLIAGEELELCLRLRQAGWSIERLDCDMTLHDAAITHFKQWWLRGVRHGWTLAEGVYRYGRSAERYKVKEFTRSIITAFVLPIVILLLGLSSRWAWLLLLIYPLQILKNYLIPWRPCSSHKLAFCLACANLIGRFAEFQGIIKFGLHRLAGGHARLIEYKS